MFLRQFVFCFALLLLTEYFDETFGLSEGDQGVCAVKISSKKTKKISYTRNSNKWCGKRKCIVKAMRIQPYVVTSDVMMCCSGWQYQSQQDTCVPLCSTGCHGGRCVAPERCQCDPPLLLDPEHPNTCFTPTCESSCFNADCTSNNTCTCHENFQTYNQTHCYRCDQGFEIDSNFKCVPKCDNPCVNGTCDAPNTCSCSSGYRLGDNFTCVPVCDSCVNGKCVAPNSCVCLEGFVAINDTHCEPDCEDCVNGVCSSPGVCECNEGYTKDNGVCEAVCNNSCVNSICSEPNVCTCYEGYQRNETYPNVCFKLDDNCNGTCNLQGDGVCESTIM
ncbi:unnamed protein product [Chilo suppressalis]|uniref:EGF-like domain-containing protein n=1 Tax=Chilo suppressalis TaxID=168631 RepID=A0ABN8BBF1_CHISP|nr:unnamed protein product [Chilo suppressalis]